MDHPIVVAVVAAVAVALLGWLAARCRDGSDRRRVYAWLRSNTRDEPAESHVETVTIAKGTRLPEDRVRRACMSDTRIHRSTGSDEEWSVWRAERQSVYEKRGLTVI